MSSIPESSLPNSSESESSRIAFFVGPPGINPERRKLYDRAYALSSAGDAAELIRLVDGHVRTLRARTRETPRAPSALRTLVGRLIEQPVAKLALRVDKAVWRGVWAPAFAIDLGRSRTVDGTPLEAVFLPRHGQLLATSLGYLCAAEWIGVIATNVGGGTEMYVQPISFAWMEA